MNKDIVQLSDQRQCASAGALPRGQVAPASSSALPCLAQLLQKLLGLVLQLARQGPVAVQEGAEFGLAHDHGLGERLAALAVVHRRLALIQLLAELLSATFCFTIVCELERVLSRLQNGALSTHAGAEVGAPSRRAVPAGLPATARPEAACVEARPPGQASSIAP